VGPLFYLPYAYGILPTYHLQVKLNVSRGRLMLLFQVYGKVPPYESHARLNHRYLNSQTL